MTERANAWRAGAAILGAALVGLAGPATAKVVTFTYTGVVSDGHDSTGVFGRSNSRLAGRAFTAVFTLDTEAKPKKIVEDGGESVFIGGPELLSDALTIGDVTLTFGDTRSWQVRQLLSHCGPCVPGRLEQGAQDEIHNSTLSRSSYLTLGGFHEGVGFLPDYDLDGLPSFPFAWPFESFFGEFSYEQTVYKNGRVVSTASAYGTLDPQAFEVAVRQPPPAAVPEPGAWTLMILGFGAAGAMLRARRRGPSLAAA